MTSSVAAVEGYPAGSPIPTAANAPTGKQFRTAYLSWADRVVVDQYRKTRPTDEMVAEFLTKTTLYLVDGNDDLRKQLSSRVDEVRNSGKDDPIFCLMAGLVASETPKKEGLLRQAMLGFPKTNYPRFLNFMAACNLARSFQDRKATSSEVAEADRVALELFSGSLDEKSFRSDENLALRWRLNSGSMSDLFKRRGREVNNILRHVPGVPDWIKELMEGQLYMKEAWKARTDDWASEITEAGWEGWQQNLARAREHLTKSWELNPHDPVAAADMIEVAMGERGDKAEMRQWFDRAVATQMDYYDAYRALIWGLRPRWLGSHEEMLQFGNECLRTERYDTCVPNYYFKVIGDIASEEPDPKAIYERPEIRHNLTETLRRYFETPDMPLVASYGHTMAAILDYRSGDLAGARKHMASIKFEPNKGVGSGLAEDIPRMMESIARDGG